MWSHLSILSGSKLSRRSSSQKEMYPIFFWRSYPKVVENEIPKRVQKRVQKPIQFCEKCDPKTDPKTDPKKNRKDFPLKIFGSVFGSVFGSMFFATFWGHFFDRFLRNLWGNSFIKFWTSFCIRFTRFWIWLPVPSESFRKTGLHFESILALNCSEQEKPNTPAVNTNQETKCQLIFFSTTKKWCVCCQSKQNGAKRFSEIGAGELSLNNTQGLFVPTKAFSLLRHSHSKLQQFKRLFRMTRIVLANIPTILQ